MIRRRYGEGPNHLTASSIAATSASKVVCLAPSVLATWATAGSAPILSSVMIHPKPADLRNDPSVQAWHVSASERLALQGHGKFIEMFGPEAVSNLELTTRDLLAGSYSVRSAIVLKCELLRCFGVDLTARTVVEIWLLEEV